MTWPTVILALGVCFSVVAVFGFAAWVKVVEARCNTIFHRNRVEER